MMTGKRYRAVLWDYLEGEPGSGAPDYTLSYEQLPKTDSFHIASHLVHL